tara:strand:- start:120 stop:335 length:216 start_codon:yes stop_codon:yes gene_type:complete
MNKENRANYPMPEQDMYKLDDINEFIKKERRHDELDRLIEVRQQKQIWKITLVFCILLNLTLLLVGLSGGN